jgi:DNA-binding NtrC family response regulator
LLDRYFAEVQRLRRATVFVDELEALSSYMQAHLLEAVEPPVLVAE